MLTSGNIAFIAVMYNITISSRCSMNSQLHITLKLRFTTIVQLITDHFRSSTDTQSLGFPPLDHWLHPTGKNNGSLNGEWVPTVFLVEVIEDSLSQQWPQLLLLLLRPVPLHDSHLVPLEHRAEVLRALEGDPLGEDRGVDIGKPSGVVHGRGEVRIVPSSRGPRPGQMVGLLRPWNGLGLPGKSQFGNGAAGGFHPALDCPC